MSAEQRASGPEGHRVAWYVQTAAQQLAGQLPEEYASERRAELRAEELVDLGKGPAVFWGVDVDEIETEGAA